MKKYKILLIDDQFDKPSIQKFVDTAKMYNIEIIGVKYHFEGMELIKNDKSFEYQAVILDAFGYKKSEEIEEKESNQGLYYSLNQLKDLHTTRLIPWFIFTGNPKNLENEDFTHKIKEEQSNLKYGRSELIYYTKTLHEKELLQDIIIEIEDIENKNIEYQYKNVFQICRKLSFPDDELIQFIDIIKSLQFNNKEIQPSLYFTHLRKYVEYVFREAAKLGLLHSKCIDNKGQVNLTESSLFLAGEKTKHHGIVCEKAHFPKILAENIKNLIFITGAASHTADVDPLKNMDYQDYRKQIGTPYLLYQLTFTVCDLLIWYESYSAKNNEIKENKKYWKEFESKIIGTLDKDSNRNYFFDEYIFSTNYIEEKGFKIGDLIEITGSDDNNHPKTKKIYPRFAKYFKKL
jgi:hypothetical protein